MKLLYATSIVYPSQLGNRLQIIAMGKEFKRILGEQFSLGVLQSRTSFPVEGAIVMGGEFKSLPSKSFVLGMRYVLLARRDSFTHVYTREPKLFVFMWLYASLLYPKLKLVFEAHEVTPLISFVAKVSSAVVAISNGIKEDLVAQHVSAKRILIARDGIDLTRFEGLPNKEQLRDELTFTRTEKVILYLGSFDYYYSWKGVDTMLEASLQAEDDWRFVLVGGKENEIELLKERFPDSPALLLPFCSPEEAPRFWRVADVLVIPNKKGNTMSERYTSPLKLFEYMASGTPIIASDLPSIREIVTEEEATFFTPNSSDSLRNALRTVFAHPQESQEKAARAKEKVQEYTWQKRAEKVLKFLETGVLQ